MLELSQFLHKSEKTKTPQTDPVLAYAAFENKSHTASKNWPMLVSFLFLFQNCDRQ